MKKLALVGCGGIGDYHLKHFVQFKDISLAGFCDVTLERAENFVEKTGQGKAYSDYSKMFDEVKPDMVFICIPPTAHGNIEFEVIQRGIPFFVEKPVTIDLELGREIKNQVEKSKLITAAGFQCRYDGMNEKAKRYIQENRILVVQASRVGNVPPISWWRNKFTSGGQLLEQTIHQMDMLRYLLETEPEKVYSVAKRGFITQEECPGYFTDDLSTTLISFKNGVTATMMTGCYAKNNACWESKMTFGSRDSRMDYFLVNKVLIHTKDETDTTETSRDFGFNCDRTFVDAVLTGDGSKIRSSYSDAFKSTVFGIACNQSMESGLPVNVGDLL